MPTAKKRINITLPEHLAIFLKEIALRDDVPQATKAAEMLERAMELEEDGFFSILADMRDKQGAQFVSHQAFWSKVL